MSVDMFDVAITALRQALEQSSDSVEQEPVAWMTNSEQDVTAEYTFSWCKTPTHDTPLYTAPPKQEFVCSTGLCHYKHWVGLTDEEILACSGLDCADDWAFDFARAIDDLLKEKNS